MADSSLNNTLRKIECCQDSSVIYSSLVFIRTKYLRNSAGSQLFRRAGGLKIIVPLTQKPNIKVVDVALSILGNCCMEEESRIEARNLNCIPALATIMNSLELESIQHRACRTVSNLALNSENTGLIHKTDIVSMVVKFLTDTKDKHCQQTGTRTLRILGDTNNHRAEIVRHEGVKAVVDLLTSDDESVLVSTIRALAQLTIHVTVECVQQISTEGMSELVKLVSHDNDVVAREATSCLVNLTYLSPARPLLGSVGVVPVFVQELDKFFQKGTGISHLVTALCLLCRESVNRVRLRESGSLKTLINVLLDDSHRDLHDRVFNSLLNFQYDQDSLKVLLDLNIVPIIEKKIEDFIKMNESDHEPVPLEVRCANEVNPDQNLTNNESDLEVNDETGEVEGLKETINSGEGNYETAGSSTADLNNVKTDKVNCDKDNSDKVSSKNKPNISYKCDHCSNVIKGGSKNNITICDTCSVGKLEDKDKDNLESGPSLRDTREQYRINSPSYQAIQDEMREWISRNSEPNSTDNSSSISYNLWSPGSDSSYNYSPDRSPPRFNLPSPPTFKPSWSPAGSPGAYSPPPLTGESGFFNKSSEYLMNWSPVSSPGRSTSPTDMLLLEDFNQSPYSPSRDDLLSPSGRSSGLAVSSNSGSEPSSPMNEGVDSAACYSPVCSASGSADEESQDGVMKVSDQEEDKNEGPTKNSDGKIEAASVTSGLEDSARSVLPASSSSSNSSHQDKPTSSVLRSQSYDGASIKRSRFKPPSKRRLTISESASNKRQLPESPNQQSSKMSRVLDEKRDEKEREEDRTSIGQILVLLTRLSHCADVESMDFIGPSCIQRLVDYVVKIPRPSSRGGRILKRIGKDPLYLRTVIAMRLPIIIPASIMDGTQHEREACQLCVDKRTLAKELMDSLCLQAESPYGVGVVQNLLASGKPEEQNAAALCIPLLYTAPGRYNRYRRKVLVESEGLDTLLHLVSCPDSPDHSQAVHGLHKLARIVKFDTLQTLSNTTTAFCQGNLEQGDQSCPDDCKYSKPTEDTSTSVITTVDIALDDGGTVSAYRKILSEASGVFAAMLEGDFRESTETRIQWKETSTPAMTFAIHFLYQCEVGLCSVLRQADLDTLLQTVALADRLLLPKLQELAAAEIGLKHLRPETVYKVYPVAKTHECKELVRTALYLTLMQEGDTDVIRTSAFKQLLADSPHVIDDFHELIKSHLRR